MWSNLHNVERKANSVMLLYIRRSFYAIVVRYPKGKSVALLNSRLILATRNTGFNNMAFVWAQRGRAWRDHRVLWLGWTTRNFPLSDKRFYPRLTSNFTGKDSSRLERGTVQLAMVLQRCRGWAGVLYQHQPQVFGVKFSLREIGGIFSH